MLIVSLFEFSFGAVQIDLSPAVVVTRIKLKDLTDVAQIISFLNSKYSGEISW